MMKEGLGRIVGEVLGSEICHELLRVLWIVLAHRTALQNQKIQPNPVHLDMGFSESRENMPPG
jgi:hypothetical protein